MKDLPPTPLYISIVVSMAYKAGADGCSVDYEIELSIGLSLSQGSLSVIAAPPDIGCSQLMAEITADLLWQDIDVAYLTDQSPREIDVLVAMIIARDRRNYAGDGIDSCHLGACHVVEVQAGELDAQLAVLEELGCTVIVCDCPCLLRYQIQCADRGKLLGLLNRFAQQLNVAIIAHVQMPALPPVPQDEIDGFVQTTGIRGFSIDEPAWRSGNRFHDNVQQYIYSMGVLQRRTIATCETQCVRDYLGNRVLWVCDPLGGDYFMLLKINEQTGAVDYLASDEPVSAELDQGSIETLGDA